MPDPLAHPVPRPYPSRRAFLIGAGAAVVAGAGAGAAFGFAWKKPAPPPPPRLPDTLVAAIAAEVSLLAAIDAVAAPGEQAALLAAIRADHVAHEAALRSLVPSGSGPYEVPQPATAALTVPELIAKEQTAAAHAARNATSFGGDLATLLASISACEHGHVELLS